jgi:hypothetical protein
MILGDGVCHSGDGVIDTQWRGWVSSVGPEWAMRLVLSSSRGGTKWHGAKKQLVGWPGMWLDSFALRNGGELLRGWLSPNSMEWCERSSV